MKKTILFLILTTAIFGGCKRFEDGPTLSFCSVKNRITGIWKVDKFYIDGIDSTDEYYSKLGCEIEFTKEIYNNSDNKNWKFNLNSCITNSSYHGFWYLPEAYKGILRTNFLKDSTFLNANSIGPFGDDRTGDWKILRLTNHEFNLTVENYYDFSSPGPNHTFTYLIKLKK